MRVLVTGGAGFIGSHVVEHFQGIADVRVLDNLRGGYLDNLGGLDHEFIEGCVTDRTTVAEAVEGVDYVFHMAAMVSVPESMSHPVDCVKRNTLGTLIVLEEAAAAGVKKLCFSSSAANYGDNPELPKVESMVPEPKSPYAITKLDGEYYCEMFRREKKLQTAVMRYFNVFGPRQDPAGAYAAAVPIFIEKALNNDVITIFGDGEQTRDFIYVKDVVAANVRLAMCRTNRGAYNVAYGGSMSLNELARKIIKLTDSSSSIEYHAPRPGDVRHSMASIEKLRAIGFEPRSTLDEGLRETIDFFTNKLRARREA